MQKLNHPEQLKKIANSFRKVIVEMVHRAQSGHPGGSLSAIDMLTVLYYYKLHHDPKNPKWNDRDRFILSKGHCTPAIYSILAELGYFPKEELLNYRKLNALLQGHTSIHIPGVEMSGGSLGQGLSYGNGIAFAGKMDKNDYKVYVMVGDGETQEGQVWEAAQTAGVHKLNNVIVLLDRNKIQNDWFVEKTKSIEPIADKWKAFNWHVIEIDGHDIKQIMKTLDDANNPAIVNGKPCVIIAQTIKGKGVSFMENNPDFHGKAPNDAEFKQAMEELNKLG